MKADRLVAAVIDAYRRGVADGKAAHPANVPVDWPTEYYEWWVMRVPENPWDVLVVTISEDKTHIGDWVRSCDSHRWFYRPDCRDATFLPIICADEWL